MVVPSLNRLLRRGSLFLFFFAASLALAAPPPLLLAKSLDERVDVSRYLISEKLDGVRAFWDGEVLRFRSGQVIHAPAWFLEALPKQALDGELWRGRGHFEQLSGVVRKAVPVDEEWRELRYMIFELPGAPGSFTQRVEQIQALLARTNCPCLQAVEQFRVPDRLTLQVKLDEVIKAGGEGLMLHLADAPYVTGRSDILLKLKPQEDAEAKVLSYSPGRGKYADLVGALQVETPDGRRFSLGTGLSDEQRRHPPALGSTVTYRYRGLTKNGLPRFASFLRVREDL